MDSVSSQTNDEAGQRTDATTAQRADDTAAQRADDTAEPVLAVTMNRQRRAALSGGGAFDHAGRVRVQRMTDFDMSRTIFGGLEGVARTFMVEKLAKEPVWHTQAAAVVDEDYASAVAARPVPAIDQRLIDFMVQECDFSMEHADGTFLEHLVFCHDYAARYYPEHSPNVALLHSILGTATNTFAMDATKIPALTSLLTEFEALHVQLFPSLLRLFYNGDFLDELEQNLHRLDALQALHCHRVIDNEPLTVDAENLWINLNFHLMHFVDFMPSANWWTHRGDPLMLMFRRLSDLLDRADQRRAVVHVEFPETKRSPIDEERSMFGRAADALPAAITLKLAKSSIQEYSEQAGHDLSYRIDWAS